MKIRPTGVTGVPDGPIMPMLIIDAFGWKTWTDLSSLEHLGAILKINNTSLIVFLTIGEACSETLSLGVKVLA